MNIHSHYEALSVMRTAPPEVIRAAYKALSQTWHPDRNKSPDAPDAMYAINVAYAQLGDEDLRFKYDQWLEAEELKWTLRHPRVQPGYVEPAKPPVPEPEPSKQYGPFEIDDWLFTQAMKKAKPLFGAKRNYFGTYIRICLLYGALGIVALMAKLTFAG